MNCRGTFSFAAFLHAISDVRTSRALTQEFQSFFTVGLFLAKKFSGFAKWRFDHIARDLTNRRFDFLDSLSSLLRIRLLNDIIETFQN